jgi:hypothetical protein
VITVRGGFVGPGVFLFVEVLFVGEIDVDFLVDGVH